MSQVLPTPSETVICKDMDDGAVLFCTRTEVYFGVNDVGRLIWSLLPPELVHFDELERRIADEFPEVDPGVIRTDVAEFLEGIVSHGLASPPVAEESR